MQRRIQRALVTKKVVVSSAESKERLCIWERTELSWEGLFSRFIQLDSIQVELKEERILLHKPSVHRVKERKDAAAGGGYDSKSCWLTARSTDSMIALHYPLWSCHSDAIDSLWCVYSWLKDFFSVPPIWLSPPLLNHHHHRHHLTIIFIQPEWCCTSEDSTKLNEMKWYDSKDWLFYSFVLHSGCFWFKHCF